MCECNLCRRTADFRKQVNAVDPALRPYFEALYEQLINVESDRDYYRAILDGSWPQADKVLANMRQRGQAERQAAAAAQDGEATTE